MRTDSAQEGTVLDSNPASGAQVAEGSTVDLVVGVAPDTVLVPNIVGFDEDRARDQLEQAGFEGTIDIEEEPSLEEEGTVATVDPEVGQPVDPDGTITLGISTGSIDLPDVTDRPEADARGVLTEAGFRDVQISTEQVESDEPPGTVVTTTPGAGQPASADTRIVLQVSGGPAEPETVAIPDVSGDPEGSARTALRNAGFTGRFTTEAVPAEPDEINSVGTVIETDPPAGTEVPLDQLITIFVVGPPEEPSGG